MVVKKNLRITINILCLPVDTWNKKNYQSKLYQQHKHWRKSFLQLLILKVSDRVKTFPLCESFWFFRDEKIKQVLFVTNKFIFLYVDS